MYKRQVEHRHHRRRGARHPEEDGGYDAARNAADVDSHQHAYSLGGIKAVAQGDEQDDGQRRGKAGDGPENDPENGARGDEAECCLLYTSRCV